MTPTPLIYPLSPVARPVPRSLRRTIGLTAYAGSMLLAAAAIKITYHLGILGPALSVLLPTLAFVLAIITAIRLRRRRVHHGWWRHPTAPGNRLPALQFLINIVLYPLAAYAAMIAFPRAVVGAGEATTSYVVIVAAAVVLIMAGLFAHVRVNPVTLVASTLAAAALIAQVVQLHRPDPGVSLGAPVHGTWILTGAGESSLLNHHYALEQQRHAIDLAMPFERVSYRPPTQLTDYPAYGQRVLAPAGGRVVEAVDAFPDQEIGTTNAAAPTGNHVVLEIGPDRYLLLGHLRAGSVRVAPQAEVAAGQPIGEVGNSGNSTEPHLHLQLQNGPALFSADGLPTPGLTTDPVSFPNATRVRWGQRTLNAADLRANDQVVFP